MEGNEIQSERPVNPRRRQRTKMQDFKEAYLPVILAALVVLLILIFIISAIRNAILNNEDNKAANLAAQASAQAEKERLDAQAAQILKDATRLADSYDYDAAIDKLGTFEGDFYSYDDLISLRDRCVQAKENLVTWNDLSQITNFSVHMLVADPERAFNHKWYAATLKDEYITVNEFSSILQQLYDNGYVLVSMEDMVTTNAAGYVSAGVRLPAGKTPIMLTQTHVNYYAYLIDGDHDGEPDAEGAGLASRLVVDGNGKVTAEMVDANGNTVTGNYDLVPILNAFIEAHPDFSYRGAKATIAVTGYEGIFGYRNANDNQQEADQAAAVAEALRADGYTIACYTYDHAAYGNMTEWSIREDINLWNEEIVPILGQVDTLVYAKNSDIAGTESYVGDKYETLYNGGFRFFIGFCDDEDPWAQMTSQYVRHGRMMLYGDGLVDNADWYAPYFDSRSVMDAERG